MNNRPKDPKTARNKNVLVIGGSGSGKTRFFVKPNLMQCVSKDYPTSFVITDPKGSLIGEVGQLLIRSSYRVKVLNTINFSKSMKYNPFRYLHSEKDVLKLVNIPAPTASTLPTICSPQRKALCPACGRCFPLRQGWTLPRSLAGC